jgi:hypothetical protein
MWTRATARRCTLIGLWLAIAFFVEAIESPVHAIGKAALFIDRIPGYLDFDAELGSVPLRIVEDIIIIDPSPKVGVSCAVTYLLKIHGGNIETAPTHCGIGAYHRAPRAISICKIKIRRNVSNIDAEPPIDFIDSSFGWGFPAILPNWMEGPFGYQVRFFDRSPDRMNSFAVNKSPFSCNQGFFAKENLVNGGRGGLFGGGDRARQIHSLIISYPTQLSCFLKQTGCCLIQATSIKSENAGEQGKKPISRLVIPIGFLLSFAIVWVGSANNDSFALWAIPAWSFGCWPRLCGSG